MEQVRSAPARFSHCAASSCGIHSKRTLFLTLKPTFFLQVVTRLTALKAWDTDGRLAEFARGKGGAATQPAAGMFNDAVRDAVRTGGKAGVGDPVRARAVHVHVL
jgi:hypothetical protein